MAEKTKIKAAKGKLGVLLPGMGAVATTFVAGVMAVRKGLAQPFGSYTQMGRIRLGKRTEKRYPKIKEFVPLTDLNNMVFGGWDVYKDSMYKASVKAGVLDKRLLDQVKDELKAVKPMKAVFDKTYVKRLDGTHIKKGKTKMDLAKALMADMKAFKKANGCDRLVMVWCGSTEIYMEEAACHKNLKALEKGLKNNDPAIPPSMIYAYAAIKMGVPLCQWRTKFICRYSSISRLS